MPGQINDPSMDLGAGIGGPGFGEDASIDPTQVDEQGDVQGADDQAGDPTQAQGDEGSDESGSDAPPWAKKSSRVFVTDKGYLLNEAEYRNHLAIKTASNPKAMAAYIKESRR
jgi:hypothetical protein